MRIFFTFFFFLIVYTAHGFERLIGRSIRLNTLHRFGCRLDSFKLALNTNAAAGTALEEDLDVDDEALIKRIKEEVFAAEGVDLDELINPSKVINLERDILNLKKEILNLSSSSLKDNEEERRNLLEKIEKKRSTLIVEKRAVMRGWLKNLFVIQSIIAVGISLAMVYDAIPGVSLPLSIKVLGFWMWWLFIVPSLRYVSTACIEFVDDF